LLLTVTPLTESLAILLYPMIALLWVTLAQEYKTRYAVSLGLVMGLATLNKPIALGVIPLLAAWFIARFRTRIALGVRMFLLSLVTMGLVILPWTIRNLIAFRTLMNPVGWQTVYMGNSPYTEYSLNLIENGEAGWQYHPSYGQEFNGLQSPVEVESKARALAIAFIRENPRKFCLYALRKVRIFWMAYPNLIHQLSWYPIAVLSVLGLAWTLHKWKQLLPLYFLIGQTALIPIFFTSMPRFRASVEPLLMVFAAYAIVRTGRALRTAARRKL
jgi:hypothetical protein